MVLYVKPLLCGILDSSIYLFIYFIVSTPYLEKVLILPLQVLVSSHFHRCQQKASGFVASEYVFNTHQAAWSLVQI